MIDHIKGLKVFSSFISNHIHVVREGVRKNLLLICRKHEIRRICQQHRRLDGFNLIQLVVVELVGAWHKLHAIGVVDAEYVFIISGRELFGEAHVICRRRQTVINLNFPVKLCLAVLLLAISQLFLVVLPFDDPSLHRLTSAWYHRDLLLRHGTFLIIEHWSDADAGGECVGVAP